jgi:trehalose-phosphatase
MRGGQSVTIDPERFDAVIFDMDGVITDTAGVHAEAWKRLFDDVLRSHAEGAGTPFEPFDIERDYLRYVDGKARHDGVRSFLESRGIALPEGADDDPPEADTVHGLGTRKNGYFLAAIEDGVDPFPSAVTLLDELRGARIATAIISASRNAAGVLDAAGVAELFDVRVDGDTAAELGLAGKPEPAVFLEAARRLGVDPARAVVVEDAESGVAAGAAGGFGLVVGVDRAGNPGRLLESGADVVVDDLAWVRVIERVAMHELPPALDSWDAVVATLGGRMPAVFLDYDGTLTPIVERPEDALLAGEMRERVRQLAERCLVAIVSGRDVGFVIEQVALDSVLYLGSHGFDVVAPEGHGLSGDRQGEFERFLGPLEDAEAEIEMAVSGITGARIERKKYAIAVHYRQAAEEDVTAVEAAVDEVLAHHPDLRKTGGKKVFELRPDIDWDKGRALEWVLEALGMDGERYAPVYLGDDLTDEDAFSVVRGNGLAIVVGSDARMTLAEFSVADTDAAGEVLERLARSAEGVHA